MFLLKLIFCISLNAPSDVLFYVLHGISRLWLLISLWFPSLDNVLTQYECSAMYSILFGYLPATQDNLHSKCL